MAKTNFIVLGFDFGTKKMGVAIGQTITLTASPLEPLLVKQGMPNWQQIALLIKKWDPIGIVVGIPLNMDSTTQPITGKAKRFVAELRNRFLLPVYEVDERLSTVEARQQLYELGGYKALRETSVDCFAAKIILEDWMRDHSKSL